MEGWGWVTQGHPVPAKRYRGVFLCFCSLQTIYFIKTISVVVPSSYQKTREEGAEKNRDK